MWLRSGLCAGQSSSYTPLSTNNFCMDLALYTGALSWWNRKEPSPNCCHKVWSIESSRMSLYAVALRFPFTGTRGPSPNHEKTAPDHYSSSTKLYSWHYAFGQVAFVHQTARWWSIIHHSRVRVSSTPESNGVELYTTAADAWHCAWWS